ncbi:MAG: diguanylate cyclase [Pseudomonadota bacterium]|nr:diguanylate cyclase [Pseudomonadota bacterium]
MSLPRSDQVKRSLATLTLLQMGIRVSLVVLAVTILSYWHIVRTLESQTVDKLSKYIVERAQRESAVFELAESSQQVLKDIFLRAWEHARESAHEDYPKYFVTGDDGAVRTRKQWFTDGFNEQGLPTGSISGFVSPSAPVAEAPFRARLVLSYLLLERYGASYRNQFANLYVHMPENVNLVYWPGFPWGLEAQADLDMTVEEWMYIAFQQHNPQRETRWTGLYYDPTAKDWMVSCETPVDWQGQHLVTIGHDILLMKLFNRVFSDHLAGAYNFIVRADGRIIAHPNKQPELYAAKGELNVQDLQDPVLADLYQRLQEQVRQPQQSDPIFYHPASDAFIAHAPIQGPDWWFVTVYPKSLLSDSAKSTAQFILLLSVISLLVELVMLYLVMRRQVIEPLSHFVTASRRLGEGAFTAKDRLPIQRQDEIGLMARTFRAMGERIANYHQDLEQAVEDRTRQLKTITNQLQKANAELELMTYTDALTQVANKRRFDDSLQQEWNRAARNQTPLGLMILDIDYFKRYNDTYGHVQGDECLRQVASAVKQWANRSGELVARIGGEEFSVLQPNVSIEALKASARHVLEAIRALAIEHSDSEVSDRVTVSVGIAICIPGPGQSAIELVTAADDALYRAKSLGRDRLSD